jgi:hypothetical protein
MSIIDPKQALTGSVRDFQELHGTDLMARVGHFYEWQDLQVDCGRTRNRLKGRLCPFARLLTTAVLYSRD